MADLDEVANLLHVHEKASAHGDLLRNIANTAMAKLKQINEEHGKPQEVVEDQTEHEPEPETDDEENEDNG
jgi:hypothetical protein